MQIKDYIRKLFLNELSIILIVTVCLSALFSFSNTLEYIELKFLNTKYYFNKFKNNSPYKNMVFIDIDDKSLVEIKDRWPWNRRKFAKIVDIISKFNPKLIYFDIVFSQPSFQDKEQDKILSESLLKAGNVLMSSYIYKNGQERLVLPAEQIAASLCGVGFVDPYKDIDNQIRNVRLIAEVPYEFMGQKGYRQVYYGGLQIFLRYMNLEEEDVIEYTSSNSPLKPGSKHIVSEENITKIKIKKFEFPLIKGRMYINYYPDAKIEKYSFVDVLNQRVSIDKKIKNKIVFIGSSAAIQHDTADTPVGTLPGMQIIATSVATMLDKNFIKKPGNFITFIFTLILSLLAVIETYRLLPVNAFLMFLGEVVFAHILSIILFFFWNYWLPVAPITVTLFLVYLIAMVVRYTFIQIENIKLYKLATTDGLTGLVVHRYFQLRLDEELARARRYKRTLSLLLSDIDHFKKFNDTYGHQQGDIVLKEVAKIFKSRIRTSDLAARYGGEEFAVIMPETDEKGALTLAERLRQAVEFHTVPGPGKSLSVTVSIGISTFNYEKNLTKEEFIEEADKALYQAKENGRNQVKIFKS